MTDTPQNEQRTPAQIEYQIIELCTAGKSDGHIAKMAGVTKKEVVALLERYGFRAERTVLSPKQAIEAQRQDRLAGVRLG